RDYRAKWNLPKDYPMVSPNYAERRRVLAKEIGLGKGGRGGRPKKVSTK
ncbi:MAG: MucR family transcriptional regulator, partial [Blastomonas sp.]|nr:MucR family transcriptional regulator [Blastomonas sp.]